jgi:hypothetical protein
MFFLCNIYVEKPHQAVTLYVIHIPENKTLAVRYLIHILTIEVAQKHENSKHYNNNTHFSR